MRNFSIDVEKVYEMVEEVGLKHFESMPIPVGYVRYINKGFGENLGLSELQIDDDNLESLIRQINIQSVADALIVMRDFLDEGLDMKFTLEESVSILVSICVFSRCGCVELVKYMFPESQKDACKCLGYYGRKSSSLRKCLMYEALTRENDGLTEQFYLSKIISGNNVVYGGEFFALLELEKECRVRRDTRSVIENTIEYYLNANKKELLLTPQSLEENLLEESYEYYREFESKALSSFITCMLSILNDYKCGWDVEFDCKPVIFNEENSNYLNEYTELCTEKCIGVLISGVEFYD